MNGHSIRVMRYALVAGRELGLSGEPLETLKLAGLLHDIGKIDTCSSVLEKSGGLTSKEFELVKLHPVHGADLLLQ
ncbi:MAG: HD domain-containing protein, partial [Nitrospiraceae bacterium]|nr:HD domain-containing protein [Nitrospiraceae bacterium]